MQRIYLDHAATTPMHPAVIEKMKDTMIDYFGNPSSVHSFGREARKIVDEARFGIAKSIGAHETKLFLQVVEQKPIIMRFSVLLKLIKIREITS